MKKFPFYVALVISILVITSCGTSSDTSGYQEDTFAEETTRNASKTHPDTSPGSLLARLNASGADRWIEDTAADLTGSDSLAVYLTGDIDGCAIWVFDNEGKARYNLEEGILDFPGAVFVGADTESELGVIFIAPEDNSPCTYNTADVLGWGY